MRESFYRSVFGVLVVSAASGCGSDKSSGPTVTEDPQAATWNGAIGPLVAKKCTGCHRQGGIGPMSLQSYATAKHYAGNMLGRVLDGSMPPWGARNTDECTPPMAFKDDPRLSDDEIALLQQWVDDGAPEGAAAAAPFPKPVTSELTDADLSLTIPTSIDVEGNDDRIVCFSLDPALDSERWIDAVQVRPGNAETVHHVLLFSDPKGQSTALAGARGYYDCFGGPHIDNFSLLGAWAPGGVPAVMPPGTALEIGAGSRLVMQVHYHPHTDIKSGVDASTAVDLRFAKQAPTYPGELALIGNLSKPDMPEVGGKGYGLLPGPDDPDGKAVFEIPANVANHLETQRVLIPPQTGVKAYRIWGVGTHMHYVGRDMKIEIEHPDGSSDCLLETPAWDFNWQRVYYYDAALDGVPVVKPGDVIRLTCGYDNTMDNGAVREALAQQGLESPTTVRLGETTLDEMCLGAFGIALDGGF